MPIEAPHESQAEASGSTGRSKHIMIVAGEDSGDIHGAALVRAIHRLNPGTRFFGMGGHRMREGGVEIIADASQMAVVGVTDVLLHLKLILQIMNRLESVIRERKPDLLILIDYPGFNLRLAKSAKKMGTVILYYISPKVWAWGKGRIATIRRYIDKMAVIFPFEESLYKNAGVNASFVGHPLLDIVKTKYQREEALDKFGLAKDKTTIALLPGSRRSEVDRLLPEMLKAAVLIRENRPGVQFVLPLADTISPESITPMTDANPVKVHIIRNETYDALAVSDIAIVASGTATLETALLDVPMVIIYRVSALTYYLAKVAVRIEHLGLVNILAGKTVVPELLQKEATGEKIAAEILDMLTNRDRIDAMKTEYSQIKTMLGERGAADRAARLALGMVGG
jgi:lipid-A-disaccharide synthase